MSVRKIQGVTVTSVAVKVLAVAPSPLSIEDLRSELAKAGLADVHVISADPQSLRTEMAKEPYDIILLSDAPPESGALELMPLVGSATVVVQTAQNDWDRVMELLTAGAAEVVTPQQAAHGMLAFALQRALKRANHNADALEEEVRKHRRAESALRERNKRFRLALKNSPVSVWFQDLNLRYTWVHNPSAPVTNLREIVGRTDEEIFGPEGAAPLVELKRKALAEGRKVSGQVALVYNGATTHHELSVEPTRDDDGTITGLVCTSVDITPIRKAEEELREAHLQVVEIHQRLERDARQRQGITNALRKQAELLDLAQDAIMVCDGDDRILYWNRGAEATYGWKSGEAVGMIAYELLLTRFPVPFEKVQAVLLREGTYGAELEHTTRDGKRIIVASRWAMRRGDDKEVTYLQINRDITERKKTNEALRESEERFRAIFAEASIGILLEDTDGRIIDANPSVQKMLGWSLEEMQNLGVKGVTHPDDSASSLKLLTDIEAGKRARQSLEKRYVCKNGATIWGSVTLFGIRDARGKLRYLTAMIADITARKQAEEQLREISEQRRMALEAASLGTWDYNVHNGQVVLDERCRMLFGVRDVETLPYNSVLSLLHPQDRAQLDQALHEAAKPTSTGRYDIEFRTVWPWDDSVHWLSAKGQAYFEGAGKKWQAVRFVGTFMDITGRKEAEEQIRVHGEHLEQLVAERTNRLQKLERQRLESDKQVAVGRMAARIAHEINNPLAGVGMAFRLVKKAVPADHPNAQYAERIEQELDRIARIVRQMFELYRPQRHDPDTFNPENVVRDVIVLLEDNLRAQGVTVDLRADKADAPVTMHEDSLKQVVFNLLQNAVEASPRGGTIICEIEVSGNMLRLAITDQGPGIPEDARAHVFEPFYTTKDYLTTGGLGLGLSITHTLVEVLGGTIDFESGEAGGTTFRVTLPSGREAMHSHA